MYSAHVDADHILFIVKQAPGPSALASSVLPTPVGTQEQERNRWDVSGSWIPAPGPKNRFRYLFARPRPGRSPAGEEYLPDAAASPVRPPSDGHTGIPVQRLDDSGDFFISHLVRSRLRVPSSPARQASLLPASSFCKRGQLAVFQLCSLIQIVFALGLFDFGVDLLDLLAELLNLANSVLLVFPLRLHRH